MLTGALALAWVGCGETRPEGAAGADGSVGRDTTPRACARAAEGCACEPGTGPVDCYVPSELGVCHAGQMYCRNGIWSGCEWTRSYTSDDGEVGGSSAPLITDFSACSTCNPGCARATDEPDATDLSNDNSDGVTWSDEGGITLGTRIPPYLPSCAELAVGLPPGGTYAQYCAESGSLFFYLEGSEGETTAICAAELAAQTFRRALCICEDLAGAFNLNTDSFDSRLGSYSNSTAGDEGDVGVFGHHLFSGTASIRGGMVAYGSSLPHFPTGRNTVSRALEINGSLYTRGQYQVGTVAGHAYVNGDTLFNRAFSVEGGAGSLHIPPGATHFYTTGMGQQQYSVVREGVSIDEPCPCEAEDLLDVVGLVARARPRNDNWVIGLDPDELSPYSSGTHLTLPCGRFYLTGVLGTGNLRITATGRTALFIEGNLIAGGNLSIDLANEDAEVDVFVAGDASVGASFQLGSQNAPSRVRFYAGGSSDITLTAGSEIGGNVYAPNARVVTAGEMSVFGSLYARNMVAGSQANFHYDTAVREPTCPPVEGRYWRDYDSTTYCGADSESRPDWGQLTWDADIPEGTDIRFEVQTADTAAGLDTATPVGFEVPQSAAPVNIGDLLVAGGEMNHRPHLRITAVLRSDGVDAPLFRSMSLDVDCGFGTSGSSDPGVWSCSGTPSTCVQVCPAEVCDDGLDNDCDGLTDCADDSCGTDPVCCTGEICGDGVSNDCDDLVDWFDDGECACTAEQCSDGLDNDANGLVDCADTDSCAEGASCNPWGSTCSAAGTCECSTGTAESSCTDGVDNNCDGAVDCDDSDCGGTTDCPTSEGCGDGADNDFDGLTDCADTLDCPEGAPCGTSGRLCDSAQMCSCPGGTTEVDCTDGMDDDCDGAVDCGDLDCAGVACDSMGRFCDVTFLSCRCPTGTVESSCQDGIDNDCDGLIDCADGDCDRVNCAGAGKVCDFATTMCVCPGGATETSCGDGLDNDCDFAADCADLDCNGQSCGGAGQVCHFATATCY